MDYTGKIISLAFPDTFVRFSDESFLTFLSYLGIGKSKYVKAGHAAFVLIENATGKAEYYDFGRYITPLGYGRVRSAETDAELEIPFRAEISAFGTIENLEQFLLWLEANPERTHGDGRLVASVCDYIDYEKARNYVLSVQDQGSIPYRAFGKIGSNCSRIVTDTILAGTNHPRIRRALCRNKKFTPSTVGNVEKSAMGNPLFEVKDGKVRLYKGSALKENLVNYFDKNIPRKMFSGVEMQNDLGNAHFLNGIGSGAYFSFGVPKNGFYEIIRYTTCGKEDFRGYFVEKEGFFDLTMPYRFIHDSNCKYCHVLQDNKKIRFDIVEKFVSLVQKEHLV